MNIANGKGVTPASSIISSGLLILGSILLPIKNKPVIMSPQTQTQTDTQEKEKKKLILKLFIRLLLYINEKNNTKKNNDDTISEEYLNSFLGYLQGLVTPNKEQNKEDINSRALDETTLEAIIGQRVYSIDKSTQQKASKATKSMTKLMEDMLTEMSTMSNESKESKEKEKYVHKNISGLLEDELKTLHKVFTQKKNAIESKANKSDEEINTIANIDGILTIFKANYNKEKEEGEEY
jgi:hypothetical protein